MRTLAILIQLPEISLLPRWWCLVVFVQQCVTTFHIVIILMMLQLQLLLVQGLVECTDQPFGRFVTIWIYHPFLQQGIQRIWHGYVDVIFIVVVSGCFTIWLGMIVLVTIALGVTAAAVHKVTMDPIWTRPVPCVGQFKSSGRQYVSEC